MILKRGGACELTVQYGVRIADGMAVNGGDTAMVQGRLSRSGSVGVIVRSSNQWTNGSGASAGRAPVALGGAKARAGFVVAPGWQTAASRSGLDIAEDAMPDDASSWQRRLV